MKNLSDIFFLIFLFYIYACSYPDIDSVPDFNNMEITTQDKFDRCNSKDPNIDLDNCKKY